MSNKNKRKGFSSDIAAFVHISESELVLADPKYSAENYIKNKAKYEKLMYNLGLDTSRQYMHQPCSQHRNRLGKIVTCGRFWGHERSDKGWLNSGYASREAKDRALNCKMVDEFYAIKGFTVSAQTAGELKDTYEAKDRAERERINARGWMKDESTFYKEDELGCITEIIQGFEGETDDK